MGKNVIISVFDKSSLDVLAKFLINKKFTIYSTGGTSKFLRKINIPHIEITKYTKQKEILGGRGKTLAWQWPVAVLLAIGLIIFIASRGPALSDAEISDSRALEIVTTHCASCHAVAPSNPAFTAAPGGIVLDSLSAVRRHSEQVMAQSVTSQAMPLGNATAMTDSERAELGQWLRLQR